MAWFSRSKQGPDGEATDDNGHDTPVTADEFASAEGLEQDVAADTEGVKAMDLALEELRGQHLSFRSPEPEDVRDLEALRLDILTAVTGAPELQDYYQEAWIGERLSSPLPAPPVAPGQTPYQKIAVMQVELMTRAFFVLQLHLFANAPHNHGWMSLFRSWGRSPRFNAVFDQLAPTQSPDFVVFYRLYICRLPNRASASGHLPIHHPWLKPTKEATSRGRGLFMDSGLVEGEIEFDMLPGEHSILDSKGSNTADKAHETPSDSPKMGGETDPPPNK